MDYLNNIQASVSFGIDDYYSVPKIIVAAFTKYSISNREIIFQFDHDGIIQNITPENLFNLLLKNGNFKQVFELNKIEKNKPYPTKAYCNSDTILQVNSYIRDHNKTSDIEHVITITLLTTSKDYINYVKDLCNKYIISDEDSSGDEIFLLKSDKNGVSLISIGTAKTKYNPENYSSKVQDKYLHLMEDLTSSEPCGRLNILSGEPGTGKTFLVKSLLSTNLNVSFIIVKPDAIESISDPSCIPALITHHAQYDRPIIIVLEDADSCLSTRMGDNMSRLSAILNTSDGILGSTLDIRIIATTNARKVDFDSAILRPGRLCTHITTDRLNEEEADKVFMRLTGKYMKEIGISNPTERNHALGFGSRLKSDPGYTLAEIYKAAYLYNKINHI